MSENLYFYKGLEEKLPTSGIKVGGLYHCTDTGNTYRGISSTEYELYSSTIQTNTGDLVKFKSNLDNSNLSVVSHIKPVQLGDDSWKEYTTISGNGEQILQITEDMEGCTFRVYDSVSNQPPTVYDPGYINTIGSVNGKYTKFSIPADSGWAEQSVYILPNDASATEVEFVVEKLTSPKSKIKMWRSGKNLFNKNAEIKQLECYPGTSHPNRWGYELHLPPGTYTGYAYTNKWNGTDTVYLYSKIKYADGTISSDIYLVAGKSQTTKTYTIAKGDTLYIYNALYGGTAESSQTLLTESFNIQIETGDTKTAYEPYCGDTFTINLGQDVYGGSFNWTTGELVINWGKTIFSGDSSERWNLYSKGTGQHNTFTNTSCYFISVPKALGLWNISCNLFHNDGTSIAYNINATSGIMCGHSTINSIYFAWGAVGQTLEDWRAFLAEQYAKGTPVEVVYELAEPITIQLIPQQIKTLPKVNYLYSDCGQTSVQQDFIEPGRFDIITAILDPETETCSHSRSELDAYVAAGKMVRGNYGGTYTYYENGMFAYDSIEEGLLIQYEVYDDKTFDQYVVAFARYEQIEELDGRINDLDDYIGDMGADFVNSTADWNQTDSNQYNYIYNKPPLKNGNGQSSMIINEGQANGKYSIAGGTTDKSLVTNILGNNLASMLVNVNKPAANGIASVAYGAGTVTHSAGTMAIGVNTQSGYKGYYFTAVNGNTLTLSTKQNSTSKPTLKPFPWSAKTLLSKGDIITVINGSTYTDCAEITAVNSTAGTITVDSLPFSEKVTVDSVSPNDYMVFVRSKPDKGEVDGGFGAFSYGYDNKACGVLSATFGQENSTTGIASVAFGRKNISGSHATFVAGYENTVNGNSGVAAGQRNIVDGDMAVAFGYSNEAKGTHSLAIGLLNKAHGTDSVALGSSNFVTGNYGFVANVSNNVRANCATAFGHGSITAKQFDDNGNQISGAPGYAQTVLGRYNAYENGEIDNALLVVGNGSDGARSNAFIVRKTGDAEVNNNLYVSGIIQAQQFNLLGSLTLSQLSTGPRIKINNSNNYLNFVNVDGASMMRIFGNSIDSTSMTPEGILTIGPNYSGGFRFETAKTSSGGVGMYITLGARKTDDTDLFGMASLSIGAYAKACSVNSVAFGWGSKTSKSSQTVVGQWNELDSNALFIVGKGSYNSTTNTETRSNAFVVDKDGNATVSNDLFVKGCASFDNGLNLNQTTIENVSSIQFDGGTNITNNSFTFNQNGDLYNINSIDFCETGSIGVSDESIIQFQANNKIKIMQGKLDLAGTDGGNEITASANLVIGNGNKVNTTNNIICGVDNEHKSMMGLTIGYGNKNYQNNKGYVMGLRINLEDNEYPNGNPRFVFGKYNATVNADDLFVLGNGAYNARSNAFVVDYNGNTTIAGTVQTKGLIVTDDSYGTDFPTDPVDGQIYFIIRG